MSYVQVMWEKLRRLLAVLAIIRFSILIPSVLILTLTVSDQMTDALVSLADGRSVLLAAGLLGTTLLSALVVWYTARTMLRFRFEFNPASDPEVHPSLKRHLPRLLAICVPAALLIKVLTLLPAVGDKLAIWRVAIALAGALVVTALYVIFRRDLARYGLLSFLAVQEEQETRNLSRLASLPTLTQGLLWGLVAANAIAIISALTIPLFLIGAPALLLLALGLAAVTGSALVYMANHYRVPVLTSLALWAAFWSFFNDNHQVRQAAQSRSHGFFQRATPKSVVSLEQSPLGAKTVAGYFGEWWDDLARQEPGTGPVPVVIVAADGGGIRAGYWTAGVLAAIEDATQDDPIPFSKHVFAISGVSGGSLGAATFAAIAAHRQSARSVESRTWVKEASDVLGRDFLSPTLSNALFLDLPQRFLPLPIFNDRAIALERSWESSWRAAHPGDPDWFSGPFHALWATAPHSVPLLFLNGTVVETGERSILDPLATIRGVEDESFSDVLQIGPVFGTQLPVSTGVLLSARFTYVSPAGLIGAVDAGSTQWHRIVDGGYFDNSGTITAQELIRIIQRAHSQIVSNGVTRPMNLIMLHISNAPQNPRRPLVNWAGIAGGRVWIGETLSPVRALLNTREARAVQATKYLMSSDPKLDVSFFEIGLWQGRTDLPLGWSLSSEARSTMDDQLKTCQGTGAACAANMFPDILKTLRGTATR